MTVEAGIASTLLEIMERIKTVVSEDDPSLMDAKNIAMFSDPLSPEAIDGMLNEVGQSAMMLAPAPDAFTARTRFNKRLRVTYHVDIWVFDRIFERKKDPSSMELMGLGDAIFRRLMFHDLRSQTEPHGYLRARSGGNVAEFRAVSHISSMLSEVQMRFFGEKDIFL